MISTSGGGGGGSPIQTLTTQDSVVVVPVANNINIFGSNGIVTTGSGNTVTISIQNGQIGQAQTVNGSTAIIITTTPLLDGTYTFEARVSGYDILGLGSAGFSRNAVFRRTGGVVTLIGDADGFSHKTTGVGEDFSNTNVEYATDGTVMTLEVTGQAGFTINWGAFSAYVFRGLV